MNNYLTNKWQECLNIINDNVDINEFETWFKPIEPVSFEDRKFIIKVPTPFYYEYIDSQYSDLICSTIKRVFGTPAQLFYRAVVDPANEAKGTTQVAGSETNKVARKRNTSEFDSQLNPELTYNNFIEGDCNRLSRTVGINIASQPGKTIFNPLFIYGKSGVGKTHLVNAIGLKTKELHPQKKVLYVSANLFQQQYTEANKNGQVNDFLNFYQTVDVLIIDDIQE
ncbi:MAG: DnaA/Hda family protein, partial [Paludibacteraceae bacterium]|nr:DnaA/Hda family protein [Paludibacteraceae bacterium]